GPGLLLLVSARLNGGHRHALPTIFGTNLAPLVAIALSVLSPTRLLLINEQWWDVIKLLGCIYIGYLGLQIFREVWQGQVAQGHQSLSAASGGFRRGFLVGISNPKDILFFAAFFPQFIGITPNLDL